MPTPSIADRFIDALYKLESDNDAEPLARFFTGEAEVGNVLVPDKFHGPDGAREFWGEYRKTFKEMRSTFRNKIVGDGSVALEWITEADGHSVNYSGVSIFEFQGDKITRFRAYFDPSALGRQIAK